MVVTIYLLHVREAKHIMRKDESFRLFIGGIEHKREIVVLMGDCLEKELTNFSHYFGGEDNSKISWR